MPSPTKEVNSLLKREGTTNTLISNSGKGFKNPNIKVVHEEKEEICQSTVL
jgi:hypothetical protein